MAEEKNIQPPNNLDSVLAEITAIINASNATDPQKSDITNAVKNFARSYQGSLTELRQALKSEVETWKENVTNKNVEAQQEKEKKTQHQTIDDMSESVLEKRLEEERREKLEKMENNLIKIQEEWNDILRVDDERLDERMKRKKELDESHLRSLASPEELCEKEKQEKADLCLLEGNLHNLEQLYRQEKESVIDTGRGIGVQGEDEQVLTTMEQAAEGKHNIKLTDSQAKLVSELKTHRAHITQRKEDIKVQKERVEMVEHIVEERGLEHASLAEIESKIISTVNEEKLTTKIKEAALEKAWEAEAKRAEANKLDVEKRQETYAEKRDALAGRGTIISNKLGIEVSAKGEFPTLEDVEQTFMKRINDPHCSEPHKKLLSIVVEDIRELKKDEMEAQAKEAVQGISISANNDKNEKSPGSFTQKEMDRLRSGNNREGPPERSNGGWQR